MLEKKNTYVYLFKKKKKGEQCQYLKLVSLLNILVMASS